EAAGDGVDDRDAAAATGLEGDARVVLAGQGEELGPAGGEQALVGGDHRLAQAQGPLDRRGGGGGAADRFDDDGDLRVVDGRGGVGGVREISFGRAVSRRISHDDVAQLEAEGGAA